MKLRMMDNDELFVKLEKTKSDIRYFEDCLKMIPEDSWLARASLSASIWHRTNILKHIEEEILRRNKEGENHE